MKNNKSSKKVVLLCTAARGGIRAVVEGYIADGLSDRWNLILLHPNREGSLGLRLYIAAKCFLYFLGLLITRQVALVHCHSAVNGSFWRKALFSLVARLAGVPVIFHLHGSEFSTYVDRQSDLVRGIIRWILEKQTVVVVLSESWSNYVQAVAPRARVLILPNYVTLPSLPNQPQSFDGEDVEVLFLGLVGPRKGVYDLLQAFKVALEQAHFLRLIIGGNGEVDRARALAEQLGIADGIQIRNLGYGIARKANGVAQIRMINTSCLKEIKQQVT